MQTPNTSPRLMLLLGIVLIATIFVWDVYTPLGVGDGVLYGIPVLLTLWLPARRGTLLAVVCVTPLILLGGYFSPRGDVAMGIAIVNRIMALLVVWGVALLVLRRKQMEVALRLSESSLEEAQQLAHLGKWDWDIVTNDLQWSDEIYRIFGVAPQAFGASYPAFLAYVHPDDRTAVDAAVQAAIRQHETYVMVHRIVRPDGVERVVFERGAVSVDAEAKPVRMIGTVQDITERWQAEQALRAAHDALESRVEERTANLLEANRVLEEEIARRAQTEAALSASELRLRTVVSGAPVVVFVLDAQGVFQLSEGRGLASLGLKPGEVVGQSIFTVYQDVPQVMDNIRRALAGEEVSMVTRLRDNWFESRCSPVFDAQGAVSGVIGVATNITATKQAEQSRLEDLHVQRDALVREVHHRIKNNLQGVIGLLRQQGLAHPELRSVMEQAITQVHSVAIVYGLHSERANADIMICDMLQAISRSLNEIYSDSLPLHLDLAVAKPIQVTKEEAVPIALIMNELITNALKHGRAEGTSDPVSIRLWGDCESAQISVRNTGVLPADFSLAERRGTGTGLQLVLALLPRNGATLAIEQDHDTINVRFTLVPPVICSIMADTAS